VFILLATRGLFYRFILVKGLCMLLGSRPDKRKKWQVQASLQCWPTLFWCSPCSPDASACFYSNRESDGGGIIKGNAIEIVT